MTVSKQTQIVLKNVQSSSSYSRKLEEDTEKYCAAPLLPPIYAILKQEEEKTRMTNDADSEMLYATLLVFGVLSAAVYLFVLRPLLPNRPQPTATQRTSNNTTTTAAAAVRTETHAAASSKKAETQKCSRVPSHLSLSSAALAVNGGTNLLVDGIVAFRHGKAATMEQPDFRKERARVLSRLLLENGVTGAPPSKGSTVVLAVPVSDVACGQLHKVLFLLSTYYNLLLLISVDKDFDREKKADLLLKLRRTHEEGYTVSSEVLPSHRVVLTSSTTGRVAFVRQFQRIELVLDFDAEIKNLLSRFGHRVIIYGENKPSSDTNLSLVGKALQA